MYKAQYKFLRVPFGLRMSQDIFQRNIDQKYENYQGAVGIADDIQGFGGDSTYDKQLHGAMERTRKTGIKLNFDKCINSKSVASLEIYTLPRE